MLAIKMSASVAPEVNVRNPVHAADKAHKGGINLCFETQGRCHQKSKTGVSVAPQKGLMSSKHEKIPKTKDMCIFGNYNLH